MEIDKSELRGRWVQAAMKRQQKLGRELNLLESQILKKQIRQKMEIEKRYEIEYHKAKRKLNRELVPKEERKLRELVKQDITTRNTRKTITGIVGAAALGGAVLFGVIPQMKVASEKAHETSEVQTKTTEFLTETNKMKQEPNLIATSHVQTKESSPEAEEENSVLTYFSEEYNKQFPEANLSEEDLGVIGKTFNRFYIVDLDEQDNILRYSQDTNIASGDQLTENQDFLLEGDYGVRDLGKNYVVVNKNNNRIIAPAIGKIELQGKQDSEMILIDTGSVRLSSSGKEYIPGDSVMQLPEDQEKLKELYDQLEDKCREIEEEKNKEQTRGETLENDDYEH